MAERAQELQADIERPDARGRRRVGLELAVGYGLIVATIWTPRPEQAWLWWASLAWIVASSWWSFPGWAAMGFRRGGFIASLWVVAAAGVFAACAVTVAIRMHTLRAPHGIRGWVLAFGGYTVWSFVQQYLLQGYFLFRFLRLIRRRELAALAAAGIFAAAHLPNPILTTVTLVWGTCACFVFLRCRNLYTVMIAHAILGISVAVSVPGPVIHNMRVGIGYLQYRAPHRHHTLMPSIAPHSNEVDYKGTPRRGKRRNCRSFDSEAQRTRFSAQDDSSKRE